MTDGEFEHLASLGTPGDRIRIAPYRADWPRQFAREAARISKACGGWIERIEHIGSTAVPNLAAKPILDLMPGVRHIRHAEHCIAPMQALGYEYLGVFGIPDRAFFVLNVAGRRVVHAHIFAIGSPAWRRHLAFRDALRGDPDRCAEYESLKRALAERHGDDRERYAASKTAFIRRIDSREA